MKNSKLTGWKNIFSFTFVQTAKSKSFKSSTIIMGLILFSLMLGVNVYSAFSDKGTEEVSVEMEEDTSTDSPTVNKKEFAHTVYIMDETGLSIPVEEIQEFVNKKYDAVTFTLADKDHDVMVSEMKTGDSDSAYLHLGYGSEGMEVTMYLPKNSSFEEQDGEAFGDRVCKYIEKWKDSYLGLSDEQKEFLSADISMTVSSADNKSLAETMVEMYVPMMLCLVLYMCIIMYGQMVGTSVATEKSSKVMELLLTSVRPLAIIVGKVLSMMALSLIQIFGYILLMLGGNVVGTMLAQQINPEYSNIVIELLTEFNLMSIFSPVRILLALVVFILGFTFYCTLAGLMGATVNRGEDLSSAMSVYSTISVLGFMIAYLPSILGDSGVAIQTFAAIFPLSSPFILPAQILTAEISNGTLAIGIVLLALLVVLFVMVVAKVYEMVILYSGNKIGMKQIRQFLKKAE